MDFYAFVVGHFHNANLETQKENYQRATHFFEQKKTFKGNKTPDDALAELKAGNKRF